MISGRLNAAVEYLASIDPITGWTAVVATLTLYVAWRTLSYSDIAVHMNAPHIIATARDAGAPRKVHFRVEGPTSDQWSVVKVKMRWRDRIQICETRFEQDAHGEEIAVGGEPQGRSVKSPVSPLFLSSPPSRETVMVFIISLKANPRLKRTCACRIEATA